MDTNWPLCGTPDRPASGEPLSGPRRAWAAARRVARRARGSTLVWLLALGLGIVLLAGLVQAGYRAERLAVQRRQAAPLLGELVRQVEAGLAFGAVLAPDSLVQERLEQALHQGMRLEAIDIVGPEGRVLMSTRRHRLGLQPAPDGSPALPLAGAAGQPGGHVVARVPRDGPDLRTLPPGTWAFALALPLLALAACRRPRRGAAGLWGLGFAVLAVAAGLQLAGAAGRLQRPLDDAQAAPATRAAAVLAARLGQAADAGVPLAQIPALNPMLRQRLREAPGVAEISLHDRLGEPLAIQAGPVRADGTVPAVVAPVLRRGARIGEVRVQRTPPRTSWLLLNLLGAAFALVAAGGLLVGHELGRQGWAGIAFLGRARRQRGGAGGGVGPERSMAEPMAGVLAGGALALAAAALVRSEAGVALAGLVGPALGALVGCLVWRWGGAVAGYRLAVGAVVAVGWCLVQG
jgi:hypothetical protein